MKKLIACLLMLALTLSAVSGMAESLTFSWWGGDACNEATQDAVAAFSDATGVTVDNTYSSGNGWEYRMSQYFAVGAAFDVNQINWNWLFSFVNEFGENPFCDLNDVDDVIDLGQFDKAALAQCTIEDELLAIPVSMTGRLFCWNETAWQKAGLEIPKTLAELMAAGPVFAEKLGDAHYPLALDTYDKMCLMVHYLQCKYGMDWVAGGKLSYTREQIVEGVQFIQGLQDAHVIPAAEILTGDGAESLDKNPKWMEGVYAGVWAWDAAAPAFAAALGEGQRFVLGEYFTDIGEHQGGFTKVSLALAIADSAASRPLSAKLIEFLLNSEEGVRLMGGQRGVPLSAKAKALCQQEGLLDPIALEANNKVMAWCKHAMDPQFEAEALRNADGLYADVFESLSTGDCTAEETADMLIEGIEDALDM